MHGCPLFMSIRKMRPSSRWVRTTGLAWIVVLGLVFSMLSTHSASARQTASTLASHAERVMIRGLTYLHTGYPDRAASVFSEGLKVHPDDPALLGAMALVQTTLGDLGTARFYLDRALLLDGDQPELMAQNLELSLASGDVNGAMEIFRQFTALPDFEPTSLLRQLTLVLSSVPPDMTRDLAFRSISWFPNDTVALAAAVAALERSGHLSEAATAASRLASLTGSWSDRMWLARLLSQSGRWSEASDVLLNLVMEDLQDPELRSMIQAVDGRLADRSLAAEAGLEDLEPTPSPEESTPTDSLNTLRTTWLSQPDDEAVAHALATYLIRNGQAKEAALLADEHIAAHPRHLTIWVLSIEASLAAGDSEGALVKAEDAELLFPGYPPIALTYARALVANNRTEDAASRLNNLLERLDRESAEYQEARALLREILPPQ